MWKWIKRGVVMALLVTGLVDSTTSRPYYGLPFVRNFSSEDYGAGIQNYAITQDNRGMLYVGNNLGLLQYDGSLWNVYPVANRTKVRSVVTDAAGRIFVGAQNELGYFFPDVNGQLTYHSLLEKMDSTYRNFGEVWKIFNTPQGIYFLTFTHVFKYQDEQMSIIMSDTAIGESFFYNQSIKFQQWNTGLMEVVNDQVRPLSNDPFFDRVTIADIIPYAENTTMICTVENGVFLYNGTELIPWDSPYQESLKSAKISVAVRLRNGSFAIGTENAGVFILESNGEFIDHITRGNGLNNRSVLSLYQDNADNLWAGLYNGITYLKISSPFTAIDERVGLPGTGYASIRFNNKLMLGTNNGLFVYDGLLEPYSQSRNYVEPMAGTNGKVYSLQVIDGKLFMGHHNGAYVIAADGQLRRLSNGYDVGWWKFQPLKDHPDALIAGTYDGMFLIRKINGDWRIITKIAGLNESSRVMEEDAEGNLWMSHGYKGVYKIRFNEALDSIASYTFYDGQNGFPSNILINVFKINNRLIFSSEHGLYSFNKALDRFELDKTFTALLGDQIQVREMTEDSNGNIYFMGDLYSGRLNRTNTGTYELDRSLFHNVDRNFNDDLENISIIDVENILIGSKEGFIHYNPTTVLRQPEELTLLMRSVRLSSSSDSILFEGSFTQNDQVVIGQPLSRIPELDFESNSLQFSFTTTDFDSEKPCEYRYQMEGLDKEWSEWTLQKDRGYTNLYEGRYALRVQARNQNNKVSNELNYAFIIHPPYYRSGIAYGLYTILFIASLVTVVMGFRQKYHRDKQRAVEKEQLKMARQEDEFTAKAKQTQEEIVALKNEKLETEIDYKNKELANSTMHLISKNEFISKVKNQLNSIASHTSATTSKELRKIAKDIDRNLASDDDWEQFEIHFDQVHGDFSKKLKAAYPQLTNQDLKLCAFLKLNMSTKEIAQMLNITVRGVELSRYRLRKKLELDRSENLTDFILGF